MSRVDDHQERIFQLEITIIKFMLSDPDAYNYLCLQIIYEEIKIELVAINFSYIQAYKDQAIIKADAKWAEKQTQDTIIKDDPESQYKD